MKIIHLSDLHLNHLFKSNNVRKTERIFDRVTGSGFDHLVITGDIADKAVEVDFSILRDLLKKFKLLDPDKVSVTIGNHDIFGGVQTALDVVEFPGKCIRTNYDEKIIQFISCFEELFAGCKFINDNSFFPFLKVLGEYALIGLNSVDVYSKLKNPFASNGNVSVQQKKDLKKILSLEEIKNKVKIVLIHHHFYKNKSGATSSQSSLWNTIEAFTMKLRGKKKLINIFKEYDVNLVLHGHSHEVTDYKRKDIQFLNAGACVDNNNPGLAEFYSIKLDNNGHQFERITLDVNDAQAVSENLTKLEAVSY